MLNTLSQRGRKMAGQALRNDLEFFDRVLTDRYDARDNPMGKIPLCIAENVLLWPRVQARLEKTMRLRSIPAWVAQYTSTLGNEDFRRSLVGFLERHLCGVPLGYERLGAAAGATAVIELTSLLLGNAGDVALFPSPSYQVYDHDIGAKAGMERVHLPDTALRTLDAAHQTFGDRLRMLVLTHPNNPDGRAYSAPELNELADWCVARRVHLVVNEIYALSRFDGPQPQDSFLRILEERRSPYLHWWYSFSKDFAVSGLRVGLLYSHNEDLITGFANSGAPHCISNPTQWLLTDLLNDDAWLTDTITANQELITTAYRSVTDRLDTAAIPYSPAVGSLFVWLDLSRYLDASTPAAEERLWTAIFEETGVLLTAPGGYGHAERGWFRLVYSCVEAEELQAGVDRLLDFLATVRTTPAA